MNIKKQTLAALALLTLSGCVAVPSNQITLPGGYVIRASKNVAIEKFKAKTPEGLEIEFERWSSTNDANVISKAAAGQVAIIEAAGNVAEKAAKGAVKGAK